MADEPFSIVAEACVNGEHGREIRWPAKTWSILNLLIFQVSINHDKFFLLGFGLSRLTSLQFIQYHVAGFYKPCILHSPPSHLRDYSKRNNARLEFSTIFVPSFDPNEWCLQNVLRNEFLNPGPLGHESSALTTRPWLLATKIMRNFNLLIFQVNINHEKFQLTHLTKNMEQSQTELLQQKHQFSVHGNEMKNQNGLILSYLLTAPG
jgi:hypothetical protein